MSKDKRKSETRCLQLLERVKKNGAYGLGINCEGGISYHNKDLQRCVARGWLTIKRPDVGVRSVRRYWMQIRRTRANLTIKGENVLSERPRMPPVYETGES